jgi:hypothetical protein
MLVRSILLSAAIFFGLQAIAQTEHQLVRKVVVFPISAPKTLTDPAEEAWWQVREAMTESKRFLVASKSFMLQKDVYQARGELTPADAIILGKLLDADALVVTYVQDRGLYMKVYEGQFGRLLWQHEFLLQPSLPVSSQLSMASKKLIQDFIASVPYQGYVVTDSLKGKPVYDEDGKKFFQADVGLESSLEIGDQVQLVRIFSDSLKPLFTTAAAPEVFAEGRIVKKDREIITVEIDRVTQLTEIKQGSLLRAPKELQRLKELYSLQQGNLKVGPEMVSPNLSELRGGEDENKPLAASLSFIANLAVFFLLAF